MKRWIVAVLALGALAVLGYVVNRPNPAASASVPVSEPPTQASPDRSTEPSQRRIPGVRTLPDPGSGVAAATPAQAPAQAPKASSLELVFNQAVETLLSPKAGYEQRQAAWQQLKDTGKLAQAVAELEQRVAGDPHSAEAATALGEGYYKEAGQTDDVREKAMLAMKADQTLEAALNLNPASWDARFMKAVGMSHWPADLNKSQEVIDQFQTLIQQQETQPQQPQFAKSYIRFGDFYQKSGNPDYASQVWQRGAALFPGNEELKGKLAAAPQPAP